MARIMRTFITNTVPPGVANAVLIRKGDTDFDPATPHPEYKITLYEDRAEPPQVVGRGSKEEPNPLRLIDVAAATKTGNSPLVQPGNNKLPSYRLTHAQRRRLITLLLPRPVSGRVYRARISSSRFMPQSRFDASASQPMPRQVADGQQNSRPFALARFVRKVNNTPLPLQPSLARGRHRLKSGMTLLAQPRPEADVAPIMIPVSLRDGMINVPTRPLGGTIRPTVNAGAPGPG